VSGGIAPGLVSACVQFQGLSSVHPQVAAHLPGSGSSIAVKDGQEWASSRGRYPLEPWILQAQVIRLGWEQPGPWQRWRHPRRDGALGEASLVLERRARAELPGNLVAVPEPRPIPPCLVRLDQFAAPSKKIVSREGIDTFLQGESGQLYLAFLANLNLAIRGKMLSDPCEVSSAVGRFWRL